MIKEAVEVRSIRILLTEDHNIVRNGIRSLLEKVPGFDVVGEASNGLEALEFLTINDGVHLRHIHVNQRQVHAVICC